MLVFFVFEACGAAVGDIRILNGGAVFVGSAFAAKRASAFAANNQSREYIRRIVVPAPCRVAFNGFLCLQIRLERNNRLVVRRLNKLASVHKIARVQRAFHNGLATHGI